MLEEQQYSKQYVRVYKTYHFQSLILDEVFSSRVTGKRRRLSGGWRVSGGRLIVSTRHSLAVTHGASLRETRGDLGAPGLPRPGPEPSSGHCQAPGYSLQAPGTLPIGFLLGRRRHSDCRRGMCPTAVHPRRLGTSHPQVAGI